MTTNNHSDITPGAPANAATVNDPLGQLDAAIGPAVSTLTTAAKTTVGGINEINAKVGTAASASGSLGMAIDTDGTLKAGAVDVATVVADGILPSSKMTADALPGSLAATFVQAKTSFQVAINELKLLECFDRYNGSFADLATAQRVLTAFRYIEINGCDPSIPLKVWMVCRNAAYGSYAYRIIIDGLISGTWSRVLDTATFFISVSENANGLTEIDINEFTNPPYGVSAHIVMDYSQLADNTYYELGTENSAPLYVIKPQCVCPARLAYGAANLFDVFERYINNPTYLFKNVYAAIRKIQITGSDPTLPHRLKSISRNHATEHYNIIIQRYTGSAWVDVVNCHSLYTVTENATGVTRVSISSSDNSYGLPGVSAVLEIDYALLVTGKAYFLDTVATEFILRRGCLEATGGGTDYDQSLNTTDDVAFNSLVVGSLQVTGTIPIGILASPPDGLAVGDMWLDTTDSAQYPIVRYRAL